MQCRADSLRNDDKDTALDPHARHSSGRKEQDSLGGYNARFGCNTIKMHHAACLQVMCDCLNVVQISRCSIWDKRSCRPVQTRNSGVLQVSHIDRQQCQHCVVTPSLRLCPHICATLGTSSVPFPDNDDTLGKLVKMPPALILTKHLLDSQIHPRKCLSLAVPATSAAM